jgi:hypothetical protein
VLATGDVRGVARRGPTAKTAIVAIPHTHAASTSGERGDALSMEDQTSRGMPRLLGRDLADLRRRAVGLTGSAAGGVPRRQAARIAATGSRHISAS